MNTNTNQNGGFTLVELLVVIVIIGLLATLITGAATAARRAARNAKIRAEIAQIQMALETYKAEIGEYPPDLYDANSSDMNAVVRHVKKRWPRYELAGANVTDQYNNFIGAINNYYQTNAGNLAAVVDTNVLASATDVAVSARRVSSLAFWLGGFPDKNGKMAGFSADPVAPLGYWVDGADAKTGKINGKNTTLGSTDVKVDLGTREKKEFLEMRAGENVAFLKITITSPSSTEMYPCLVNDVGSGTKVPYIYFRAAGGDDETLAYCYRVSSGTPPDIYEPRFMDLATAFNSEWGWVAPYARPCNPFDGSSKPLQWYEPGRFQIIHPGLDACFGSEGTRPTSPADDGDDYTVVPAIHVRAHCFRSADPNARWNTAITKENNDNITNFSQSTFEGLIP